MQAAYMTCITCKPVAGQTEVQYTATAVTLMSRASILDVKCRVGKACLTS